MQVYVLYKQRTKLARPTSLSSPLQWRGKELRRIQPIASQRRQGDRSTSHCTAINTKRSTSLRAAKEPLVPTGLLVFCLPDFKHHQQQTQNQLFLFFKSWPGNTNTLFLSFFFYLFFSFVHVYAPMPKQCQT